MLLSLLSGTVTLDVALWVPVLLKLNSQQQLAEGLSGRWPWTEAASLRFLIPSFLASGIEVLLLSLTAVGGHSANNCIHQPKRLPLCSVYSVGPVPLENLQCYTASSHSYTTFLSRSPRKDRSFSERIKFK